MVARVTTQPCVASWLPSAAAKGASSLPSMSASVSARSAPGLSAISGIGPAPCHSHQHPVDLKSGLAGTTLDLGRGCGQADLSRLRKQLLEPDDCLAQSV